MGSLSEIQATHGSVFEPARLQVRIDSVELRDRRVVSALEFVCEPGQHTVILGPNGAGKTTLLRAIVGLVPCRGTIQINQRPVSGMSSRERARFVAYVPQRSLLTAALSVQDVVTQGRFAHRTDFGGPSRRDREVVSRALAMTDTTALAGRAFSRLSGGEQRRVLLARALATEAPIIVLDEPTSFLDIAHSLQLFEQLAELRRRGHTLLSVLHNLHDAESWADQALVLQRGEPRYLGSAKLPSDLVETIYGVRVLPNSAPSYQLLRRPDSEAP